jgi:uncharacterized protein (TIGR02271 family)
MVGEKEFSVQVWREGVQGERPFQGESVMVPLRAEEAEVRKRPMGDEEVIIRKDAIEEGQQVAETARSEEVEIHRDPDVEGPRKLDMSPDDPKLRR